MNDTATLPQGFSGNINYLECSIFGWFYRQNLGYLKKDECSFSGKYFGDIQIITAQEAPFVEV
jgi:hypothetical protein